MESQFFDWNEWNQSDTMIFIFTDCTLKVQIGDHKPGENVPTIIMDYEHGQMQLIYENKARKPTPAEGWMALRAKACPVG